MPEERDTSNARKRAKTSRHGLSRSTRRRLCHEDGSGGLSSASSCCHDKKASPANQLCHAADSSAETRDLSKKNSHSKKELELLKTKILKHHALPAHYNPQHFARKNNRKHKKLRQFPFRHVAERTWEFFNRPRYVQAPNGKLDLLFVPGFFETEVSALNEGIERIYKEKTFKERKATNQEGESVLHVGLSSAYKSWTYNLKDGLCSVVRDTWASWQPMISKLERLLLLQEQPLKNHEELAFLQALMRFHREVAAVVGSAVAPFATCTINYNSNTHSHVDHKDYSSALSIVVVAGNFTAGGDLFFKDDMYVVKCRPGDLVIFDSKLQHGVCDCLGRRHSLVFYLHNDVLKKTLSAQ